jgi:hypothetical protein
MVFKTTFSNISVRRCRILQKVLCQNQYIKSDNAHCNPAHGRWFSLGTLPSSTTKTGRHDIAEILMKVALNIKNQINSFYMFYCSLSYEITF